MSRFSFFAFVFVFTSALNAAEVTAVLDFSGLAWGTLSSPMMSTMDAHLQWHYNGSATAQIVRENKDSSDPRLSIPGSNYYNYLETFYNGTIDGLIPNIRTFTFRAKAVNSISSYKASIEVEYREPDGSWTTTNLASTPSLDGLSTDWQTFTITLPEGHTTASLRLKISTGSNTLLLDDLILTYDPNPTSAPDPSLDSAPDPSLDPDPCTNCFTITFR